MLSLTEVRALVTQVDSIHEPGVLHDRTLCWHCRDPWPCLSSRLGFQLLLASTENERLRVERRDLTQRVADLEDAVRSLTRKNQF